MQIETLHCIKSEVNSGKFVNILVHPSIGYKRFNDRNDEGDNQVFPIIC